MKIITIILSTIVLNTCGGTKKSVAEDLNQEVATNKEGTMEINESKDTSLQIAYTAITRGAYKHLEVSEGIIRVKKSHADKGSIVNCTKEQWGRLLSLSKDINLQGLSKLEAPSKASHYDGAMAATLKVTKDGKIYETSTFDHGNPPKEIKELVDYILTVSDVE